MAKHINKVIRTSLAAILSLICGYAALMLWLFLEFELIGPLLQCAVYTTQFNPIACDSSTLNFMINTMIYLTSCAVLILTFLSFYKLLGKILK